ncbi:MAG: sugar phosphate isomerase/epimerase [Eubacteriales bacterium]|nr:sugar phosphate isomerase/epimerase [Eubacteriales bacterium]
MKFAISSYSFTQAMRDGRMTMLDVIPKAKEMGFDGVEIVPLTGTIEEKRELAPKLAAQAKEYGVEIAAYLIGNDFLKNGVDAEVERLKQEVEIAAMLGATKMRHDATAGKDAEGNDVAWDDALPLLADGYRRVTEYAAGLGVHTMIENHGYYAQNSWRVKELIETVGHKNFGWLCDIGNFLCADEDPAAAVKVAAPYAIHAHAKDFHLRCPKRPAPNAGWFPSKKGTLLRGAIVGHGEVPVDVCLKTLVAAGYDGWLSLEFEGMEDCFMAIAEGFTNIKNILG